MPINTSHTLLNRRRTKIVATLGPASSASETLDELIAAGVDVFRLNFSHGDLPTHEETYHQVRRASERAGRAVGIIADLPGPKIRVGRLEGGAVTLVVGEEVIVTTRDVLGGPGLIPSQHKALAQDVSAGDMMLLDDGNLELEVMAVSGTEVTCKVIVGGILKDKKGMNLPGVKITAPSLTEKDESLARFALGLGVDFLALSFVRRPSDIQALREVMATEENKALLIAKIEKAEALREIEGIIREADGIMVARGDLGVELRPEKVPAAQAQLVEMARNFDKPVIVATQMLESMIRSPRPTRAEVMDVSNAVSEGTDAVMLSGETAVGEYPVRAVEMMDRVIRETEGYLWPRRAVNGMANPASSKVPPLEVEDAVARATAQLSRDLRVTCIVVFTRTGRSAGKVSAGRPPAPILSATRDPEAGRRTSLYWGVEPVVVGSTDPGPNHEHARKLARDAGLASEGDYVLEVRGFHADPERNVPTLVVCKV